MLECSTAVGRYESKVDIKILLGCTVVSCSLRIIQTRAGKLRTITMYRGNRNRNRNRIYTK